MSSSPAPFERRSYLGRIGEQFREIASEIGEPFRSETWVTNGEAVLRFDREDWEEPALCLRARFVDDGDGMEDKLALLWECKGEVSRLLGLGWKTGTPDVIAGLDGTADHIDAGGVYAIGKVVAALRADILAELKAQGGAVLVAPVSGSGSSIRPCAPHLAALRGMCAAKIQNSLRGARPGRSRSRISGCCKPASASSRRRAG